jgi:hypothetical protein
MSNLLDKEWVRLLFLYRIPPVTLAVVLLGCEQGPPEVNPQEGESVARIAEPAATELLQTLVGELVAAMEEGGPAHAIGFCSTEAISLTRVVQAGLGESLDLKRTSFRYRNADNAPDEAEEAALLFFEKAILDQGQAPSSYVQWVSEDELRYYKPLFVGEFCLACHGDPASMDPLILKVLEDRYPEDLATGYEVGAFRGVVRVSVPAEAVGG